MGSERPNVSSDIIWHITRNQNAFLVKRRTGGGSQFSRDPLNLLNKHSFKYAGHANNKAIGVHSTENGGVAIIIKEPDTSHQPAQNVVSVSLGPKSANREVYMAIANTTPKGYRADLRGDAVARASALIRSYRRPKAKAKNSPAKKTRGAKAKAKKAAKQKSS